MKKLLLVLMVVAMASFLFVGCLPGTTTPPPEEPPVEPTVTITVAGEYYDAAKGLTYVQGCVPKLVTVTFTEPVAEEYGVQINGIPADVKAGSDRKIWTKEITIVSEIACTEVCLIVTVGHPCCPDDAADTYWKLVVPDCVAPCASFVVTFKDCGICLDVPGAEMSWTTTCEDICDVPKDCCGDDCSGVGDWKFVLDDDVCLGACDTETGNDCDITGAFECGCLSYANALLTGIHEVLVSIKDNVGNEFTDTWTITFDTDNVTTFAAPKAAVGAITYDAVKKEWTVDVVYPCDVKDCLTCFPLN